jgi:putative peptidoglycan lipid II flippase
MAVPVVRLLVQHGATKAHSTEVIAHLLVFFSIGLFPFSCFQLLLRAFYAMQDTRTPAKINIVAVALNVVVDLIYFRYLKVEGLALGHATAYTFAAVTAAVIIGRRVGGLEVRRLGVALGKILVGGLAAGGAAFVVSRWIAAAAGTSGPELQLLQVAGGVLAGMVAYLVVARAFRVEELLMIRDLVSSWSGRRRGRFRT